MRIEERAVGAIVVGSRVRKDPGNILQLMSSIRGLGLLQPIVVNGRNELIAGFRRLEAVKRLGWATVSVHVVATLDDAAAALRGEMDENTCREPFTPLEIVEIGRRIEALEKPAAKERQKELGKSHGTPCGNLPQGVETGKTRDKVGEALGVSGRTYEKAKAVVEAAEAEPEKFADLPQRMNETSVDAAHREMKARRKPKGARNVPKAPPTAEPGTAELHPVQAIVELIQTLKDIVEKINPRDLAGRTPWDLAKEIEDAGRVMIRKAMDVRKRHHC